MATHHFDSTEECYDSTQTDDDITFNDLLVVETEKVVGVLCSAWPVAVTAAHGELHAFAHPSDRRAGANGPSPEEKDAITAAIDLARRNGWDVDSNAEAQVL